MTVAIDARLVSGTSGGVEAVVVGLASGLALLEGDGERYRFMTWAGHDEWIRPYLGGGVSVVVQPTQERPERRTPLANIRRIARIAKRTLADNDQLRAGPRSDAFVESIGADVVHFPIQWGARTRIPTIYHPHDLQHVHLPELFTVEERQRREHWYGTLCRQAQLVAVSSTWTKFDVETHFSLPPSRVRVVPLAPPLDAVARPVLDDITKVAERLGLPASYLVYPAQTWPHKNHVGLLEGLARLREGHALTPAIVLTGFQTPFADQIRRRVGELALEQQVHWTGFLPPGDLAAVIAGARGLVVPSRFESASGPLWEAFSAGVPAATSDVTSLPRQAGKGALLFDPDDYSGMAEALRALWVDDGLRARLVKVGREQVAGLSWERTARHFRAHYRRLAGRALTDEDHHLLTTDPLL